MELKFVDAICFFFFNVLRYWAPSDWPQTQTTETFPPELTLAGLF